MTIIAVLGGGGRMPPARAHGSAPWVQLLRRRLPRIRVPVLFAAVAAWATFSAVSLVFGRGRLPGPTDGPGAAADPGPRDTPSRLVPIEELDLLRGIQPEVPDVLMSGDEFGTITVFVDTEHQGFFGNNWPYFHDACPWRLGDQIDCEFTDDPSRRSSAHTLFVHAPHRKPRHDRAFPEQKKLVVCMESPDHYNGKLLADEDFMKDFDYEMSYRARAHVPWLYSEPYLNGVFNTPHRLWDPPVPFSEKLNAVAYLNSNCHTPSGRAEAMEALIQMNVYPVHAFGRCSHNKDLSPDFKSKVELFSKYKFCIAIENSNVDDYITEKVYQALSAGCIPIYGGASNIGWHMPVPVDQMMIIFEPKRDSVGDLAARLAQLSNDQAAYEGMLAWKTMPVKDMSPGFRFHVKNAESSVQCKMCQIQALDVERRRASS